MSHPSPIAQDMAERNRLSARRRQEKARLRRALATGELELSTLLLEAPDCLKDDRILQVVAMQRGIGPRSIATLGRMALKANVNLAQPLGWASQRTRQWVAENVGAR